MNFNPGRLPFTENKAGTAYLVSWFPPKREPQDTAWTVRRTSLEGVREVISLAKKGNGSRRYGRFQIVQISWTRVRLPKIKPGASRTSRQV